MRAAIAVLLSLLPTLATAQPCETLDEILHQAEIGFAPDRPLPAPDPAADCALSQNQTGTQTYLCLWQFAYRDSAATARFEALDTAIRACLSGLAPLPADPGVNHPDSYQLRQYRRQGTDISVSLKDKAARGQSLVFLRLDPAAE